MCNRIKCVEVVYIVELPKLSKLDLMAEWFRASLQSTYRHEIVGSTLDKSRFIVK